MRAKDEVNYTCCEPRKSANWSGIPKSLILTGPAAFARALRVSRSSQERRWTSWLKWMAGERLHMLFSITVFLPLSLLIVAVRNFLSHFSHEIA